MPQRRYVLWLSLSMFLIGVCCYHDVARAAIGIYDVTVQQNDVTATISYRINENAVNGTIKIMETTTGTVVRTIILPGDKLIKGLQTIVWDGNNDNGGSVESGSYKAEITVYAAKVPAEGTNIKWYEHGTGSFYGLGIDNNPENPAYGRVYVADCENKSIQVYYPDGVKSSEWYTGFTSINTPFGIAVAPSGRILTTCRYSEAGQGPAFWSFSADGQSRTGGPKYAAAQPIYNGIFTQFNGSKAYVCSGGVGKKIERRRLNPDGTFYFNPNLSVPANVQREIDSTEGILPQGTLYYRICAFTGQGNSPDDDAGPPTDDIAVEIKNPNSKVKLTWNPVQDADGYRIYRMAEAGTAGDSMYVTRTNNIIDDGNLNSIGVLPPNHKVIVSGLAQPSFGVCGGFNDGSKSDIYIALYGNNPSLVRYKWDTGSNTYLLDADFVKQMLAMPLYNPDGSRIKSGNPAADVNGLGITCVSVDVSSDGTHLIVGREEPSQNLVWVDLENQKATVFQIDCKINSVVLDAKFSAVGNVIYLAGGNSRYGLQRVIGEFMLPDEGSSDLKVTGTFSHTRRLYPPVFESGSASPEVIPADGITPVILTVQGYDNDGLFTGSPGVVQVLVDLSPIGGGSDSPMSVTDIDSNHFTATLETTVSPDTKTGTVSLGVLLIDNNEFPLSTSGVITLTVPGGVIEGMVTQPYLNISVEGANVIAALSTDNSIKYLGNTDTSGNYRIEVQPGIYNVSVSKVGFSSPADVANVTALSGQSIVTDLTLGPISILDAKKLTVPDEVCITGVVCSQKIESVQGVLGGYFVSDTSTATALGVNDPYNTFIEGDEIVLMGTLETSPAGMIQTGEVTGVGYISAGSSYPAPVETTILTSGLTSPDSGGADPTKWGDLVVVKNVSVVDMVQSDGAYDLTISDFSGTGIVRIYEAIQAQIPNTGDVLNITGLVAKEDSRGNILIPRKSGDVERLSSTVTYSSMEHEGGYGPACTNKWNLISLPGEPVSGSPEDILKGIQFDSFQIWNNIDLGGGYLTYRNNWFGPMRRGECYWMVVLSADHPDFSYQGYPQSENPTDSDDFKLIIPEHQRTPYWIMFGLPFNRKINCNEVMFSVDDDPSQYNWETASSVMGWIENASQGFNPAAQGYFIAAPQSTIAERTYLEPWYGYWMMIKTNMKITITFPARDSLY